VKEKSMTRFAVALAALLAAAPAVPDRIYWNDRLASELIGSAVASRRGERLGEIRDLVVDLERERVPLALLEFGGFLGLGKKVLGFPLTSFAPGNAPGQLLLDIHPGELERAGLRPPYGLPLASELVGRNVNDRSGRDAGELQDLVVNLGSARVRHAVLTLDRSERQVTIAPARLSARAPAADLVVEIYLAELRALVAAGL
jgi:sporulation protein YlmC with PRC-barrel domain